MERNRLFKELIDEGRLHERLARSVWHATLHQRRRLPTDENINAVFEALEECAFLVDSREEFSPNRVFHVPSLIEKSNVEVDETEYPQRSKAVFLLCPKDSEHIIPLSVYWQIVVRLLVLYRAYSSGSLPRVRPKLFHDSALVPCFREKKAVYFVSIAHVQRGLRLVVCVSCLGSILPKSLRAVCLGVLRDVQSELDRVRRDFLPGLETSMHAVCQCRRPAGRGSTRKAKQAQEASASAIDQDQHYMIIGEDFALCERTDLLASPGQAFSNYWVDDEGETVRSEVNHLLYVNAMKRKLIHYLCVLLNAYYYYYYFCGEVLSLLLLLLLFLFSCDNEPRTLLHHTHILLVFVSLQFRPKKDWT